MAQLEYDDSGSTFYYFLISFYALVLLPLTYFLWPRRTDGSLLQLVWWVLNGVMILLAFSIADERQKGLVCQCEPCRKKRVRLDVDKPKKRLKHIAA